VRWYLRPTNKVILSIAVTAAVSVTTVACRHDFKEQLPYKACGQYLGNNAGFFVLHLHRGATIEGNPTILVLVSDGLSRKVSKSWEWPRHRPGAATGSPVRRPGT
jgi:hypothetical protein